MTSCTFSKVQLSDTLITCTSIWIYINTYNSQSSYNYTKDTFTKFKKYMSHTDGNHCMEFHAKILQWTGGIEVEGICRQYVFFKNRHFLLCTCITWTSLVRKLMYKVQPSSESHGQHRYRLRLLTVSKRKRDWPFPTMTYN